jgi:hypothetical protein
LGVYLAIVEIIDLSRTQYRRAGTRATTRGRNAKKESIKFNDRSRQIDAALVFDSQVRRQSPIWGVAYGDYSTRGVPSRKASRPAPSRALMSRVQIQGGNGMKATRRVTSEALAHMLAVTAMLVIASIILHVW